MANKLKVVGLYDNSVAAYTTVICCRATKEVVASARAEVNSGKGLLAQYPEDYEIRELGEVDVNTGQLTNYDGPVFVCQLQSLKQEVSHVSE